MAVAREPRPAALDDPPREAPERRAEQDLEPRPAPPPDPVKERSPLAAALEAAGRTVEGPAAPAITEERVKAWIAEALEAAKASWVEELRRAGGDGEPR